MNKVDDPYQVEEQKQNQQKNSSDTQQEVRMSSLVPRLSGLSKQSAGSKDYFNLHNDSIYNQMDTQN